MKLRYGLRVFLWIRALSAISEGAEPGRQVHDVRMCEHICKALKICYGHSTLFCSIHPGGGRCRFDDQSDYEDIPTSSGSNNQLRVVGNKNITVVCLMAVPSDMENTNIPRKTRLLMTESYFMKPQSFEQVHLQDCSLYAYAVPFGIKGFVESVLYYSARKTLFIGLIEPNHLIGVTLDSVIITHNVTLEISIRASALDDIKGILFLAALKSDDILMMNLESNKTEKITSHALKHPLQAIAVADDRIYGAVKNGVASTCFYGIDDRHMLSGVSVFSITYDPKNKELYYTVSGKILKQGINSTETTVLKLHVHLLSGGNTILYYRGHLYFTSHETVFDFDLKKNETQKLPRKNKEATKVFLTLLD